MLSTSDGSLESISKLVENKREDLILLTDDVYGTFVDGFRSLATIAPRNTILVYSYSKYFGATGWRLGAIGVHEDNVMDEMIADLPEEKDVVVLDGGGFDAPEMSVRVSLANLYKEDYEEIGAAISELLEEYKRNWEESKSQKTGGETPGRELCR